MTPEEKAKHYGVPLVPKRNLPAPSAPHGVVAICGECGLELRGTMGYFCPKQNCPTGLGSTGTYQTDQSSVGWPYNT